MSLERKIWSEQFTEWFSEMLLKAEIADFRYPLKGWGVWMPYGFKLRKHILDIMRRLLDETGHQEVLFPLLIPEDLLAKEAVHIKSFFEECFWVTRGGSTEFDVKYALRPTSETAITPMVKLWVRSHADLQLKLYQVVSVFRYETKATRPLIRVREVTTFKEAHTFHRSYEDAARQVEEGVEIYKKFFDEICVPYQISQRPEWDKFAGAVYTYAFDTISPDGRSLQIGTVHHLGTNFTKAFDFTYETREGKREYPHSTSYGISERVVAAVMMVHGDDRGLVLPPNIAPIQVIVIPIPYKGVEEVVNEEAKKIVEELKAASIRAEADLREDVTPGSKYYDWEIKGVPIRVEVGPRDVERKEITLVRRDTLERTVIPRDKLVDGVKELMEKLQNDLRERAWKWLREHVHRTDSIEEARKLIDNRQGVVEVMWCGEEECGFRIEEGISGRVLGMPIDTKEEPKGNCIVCGKPAKQVIRIARAF